MEGGCQAARSETVSWELCTTMSKGEKKLKTLQRIAAQLAWSGTELGSKGIGRMVSKLGGRRGREGLDYGEIV